MARALLTGIDVFLDQRGAWAWNSRLVGIFTSLFLLGVRIIFQKKRGIDWYALTHAVTSTTGAATCLYLDWMASEHLTGVAEPLRSIHSCQGPLTSLHRILPAMTMGYALFDLLDGLSISVDFALHGAVTLAEMVLFVELMDAPQIIAPMLIMEGSTIFLNLVKADFLSKAASITIQFSFVSMFFICRLLLFPLIWFKLMSAIWQQRSALAAPLQDCYPAYFPYVCFLFGMFYNCINLYWFRKIVRKVQRRWKGVERHNERNDLAEYDDNKAQKKTKTT